MACSDLSAAFQRLDQAADPLAIPGLIDQIVRCGPEALETARERLARPDLPEHSMRNAIRVLASQGLSEDRVRIIEALDQPSEGVRETAALALRNSFSAEGDASMIAAALRRETRLETRVLLVGVLARTEDPQWVALMTELSVVTPEEELERLTSYGRLSDVLEQAIRRLTVTGTPPVP